MRALRFYEYGAPSTLRIEDLPLPEPGPGEALIAIQAAAISPSDIGSVAGKFHSKLPCTPGRDFAGTVLAGEGWVGKEVWGTAPGLGVRRDGAHAEYLAIPLDWLSEKPPQLSMEQAAAVGIPYLAAWLSLVTAAQLETGERVLITGANGAVGRAAIQIAHWRGAQVLGADITEADSGADIKINVALEGLEAQVMRITAGAGVDVVLDTVGANLFQSCLRTLRVGGRHIALASASNSTVTFNLVDFYHNQTRLLGVDTQKATGPEIAAIMNALREGFAAGRLTPPEVQTWNFEEAVTAYTGVSSRTLHGKQVLLFPHHASSTQH